MRTRFSNAPSHLHHLVDVAGEKTAGLDRLQGHALRQQMHVRPGDARLQRLHHGARRSQDGVVNQLLLGREFSVGREGAGYVGRVAERRKRERYQVR